MSDNIIKKKKETNKKTIDLPAPLHVHTRTLVTDSGSGKHGNNNHGGNSNPIHPVTPSGKGSHHHSLMSTTMICIAGNDPASPKLFLRGTSEHVSRDFLPFLNDFFFKSVLL